MKGIAHFLKPFKNHYVYVGKKKFRIGQDTIYFKGKAFIIPKEFSHYILKGKKIELFFDIDNAIVLSFKEIANFDSRYLDIFTSRNILRNLVLGLEKAKYDIFSIIIGVMIGISLGLTIGLAIAPSVLKLTP
jgi:hypothetical protein